MRRRALLLALPLAAWGAVAVAATQAAGQYVDLAPVALPIVVDGRLINYVFVDVRIDLTAAADLPKLRDMEPYFRDALVRAGHRTPFTRPDDYTRLDEARLKSALFAAAVAIAGPGNIAAIEILPGGGPMRRSGLPTPRLALR
ncbi:MAG TPA: hypothetical protein VMU93_12500 [Caulobacteraceae bacterium]|nr:hypothetical protein [Caulobacteraceae bacterium]